MRPCKNRVPELWTSAMFFAATLFVTTAAAAESHAGLGRSLAKLRKDNALKIGYFGGSITAGTNASAGAKAAEGSKASWRTLTTGWFKQQFPAATITEIDATIDGTGSDLGAFRCQTDLLKKDPDLVFVEFAADDGETEELRVKRSMEGIVRQIWLANPFADVVFVHATTKASYPAYAKGELPSAVRYHQAIARHYGIPEINVGRAIAERIIQGGDSWETLTTDGLHLNDAGCAICMEAIQFFLKSHLNDAAGPALFDLPDELTKDPFVGAHFEDATLLNTARWRKEKQSLGGHYPRYLAASEAGTPLVYTFSGTTIGLFWLVAPDGGDLEWSIDDGKPTRLSSWDNQARASYDILADNLSSGEHTLKIALVGGKNVHSGEKNAPSAGTWIRIGAFLVHCPC